MDLKKLLGSELLKLAKLTLLVPTTNVLCKRYYSRTTTKIIPGRFYKERELYPETSASVLSKSKTKWLY